MLDEMSEFSGIGRAEALRRSILAMMKTDDPEIARRIIGHLNQLPRLQNVRLPLAQDHEIRQMQSQLPICEVSRR